MGRFLASAHQTFDLALTSPAVRAVRTLQIASRVGRWGCAVRVRPALYGKVEDVVGEIRTVPDNVRSLLLVGHEPAWSAVARLLTGGTEIRLPTASMLRLVFEIDRWSDIDGAAARIEWLVVPRLLDGRLSPDA